MSGISTSAFVHWFRSAAPYIHGFRGRTFIVAFGGEVVEDGKFVELTHDLNLLASVGVKLVLVHGARPQIERELDLRGIEQRYAGAVRVTDEDALGCAKQASGRLRVEIEALLSMGLPNSPMAGSEIRVASGNFVVARPRGIVDGVDMLYTGEVRKIEADAIRRRLDDNELVLISPLGYSPTGEIFNLTLEDVAAECAVALQAEKLIVLTDESGVAGRNGKLMRELTVSDAQSLLESTDKADPFAVQHLPVAIKACRGGVKRVHLVDRKLDGSLLLELFTHEGVGSMISQDSLEMLRQATIEDVGGILQLIEPLEANGTLAKRSRELLEIEIDRFIVLEHDKLIVGCAALYPCFEENAGELACLAVHPLFQNAGSGEMLLQEVERRGRELKLNRLFVLTTAASHWFIEHGFESVSLSVLPAPKAAMYNYQRNSRVLQKTLS
ncbi:MAG: amino-acid N-acetyltransferase [Betaproteobacteria bacterium]|nr:MAG: amino-acid N-acetyltransferase [Betaproteobacteria bacterium]